MQVVFPWVQEVSQSHSITGKQVFCWAVAKMQFGCYQKFLLASTFGEDREFLKFLFLFFNIKYRQNIMHFIKISEVKYVEIVINMQRF